MYLCLCHNIVFDTLRYVYMELDFDKMVLIRLQRIPIGQTVLISEMAKKDPDGFIQATKRLIRSGWSEYEFTNDYDGVRRLDLPDFARDFFRKLKNECTKKTREHSSRNENRTSTTFFRESAA